MLSANETLHNKALNTLASLAGTKTRRAFGIFAPCFVPLA